MAATRLPRPAIADHARHPATIRQAGRLCTTEIVRSPAKVKLKGNERDRNGHIAARDRRVESQSGARAGPAGYPPSELVSGAGAHPLLRGCNSHVGRAGRLKLPAPSLRWRRSARLRSEAGRSGLIGSVCCREFRHLENMGHSHVWRATVERQSRTPASPRRRLRSPQVMTPPSLPRGTQTAIPTLGGWPHPLIIYKIGPARPPPAHPRRPLSAGLHVMPTPAMRKPPRFSTA